MSSTTVSVVKDGMTSWRLFVPRSAGQVERFAADELIHYVNMISGATLQRSDRRRNTKLIIVGVRSDLDQKSLPKPKLGFDGYTISVSPETIVIAGDNPRGVLYGVYDLLERLGCRWYHPQLDPKDPEVVPKSASLALSMGEWSESARIEDRYYWMSSLAFTIVPERVVAQLDWAAKNRYNGVSWQCVWEKIDEHLNLMHFSGIFVQMQKRGLQLDGPGHSMPYFLKTQDYFDEHPDWFGLKNAQRQPHGGPWPATNYCTSNKEANETFMANVVDFVRKNPEIRQLDLIPADGGRPCECLLCQQRHATDQTVELFNELSERLEKVNPDVILTTVPGYCPIELPPERSVPNGKWQGIYAHWGRNHKCSYSDADYPRRQNLLVWASYFKRFQVCSYYAANSHQPFFGPPFLHALKADTEFYIEQGITGAFVLEYPFGFWWNNSFNVRMGGLYPYYCPDRDPVSEIRDYAIHYYGAEAGRVLAQYFLMLGDNRNLERSYRASRGEADAGDMDFFREMRTMIKRAEQLAEPNPIHSYRVSKLAMGMDFLLQLAPTRSRITAIQKVAEECIAGRSDVVELRTMIADARAMIALLEAEVERLAAAENGVISEEWLKGWILKRTYSDPLLLVEKKLDGLQENTPEKPNHIVDTNL
ncbi:MAG TPA: DUF4838 domain-containing protein [bacterium]|nr:DUF4838 domain-containing protein [bacterium]